MPLIPREDRSIPFNIFFEDHIFAAFLFFPKQMVDSVKEAFDYLTRNQEMVKHSFEVCGITVSDTEKVRNADFYKWCMKDALESLGNEVEGDDDSFTL